MPPSGPPATLVPPSGAGPPTAGLDRLGGLDRPAASTDSAGPAGPSGRADAAVLTVAEVSASFGGVRAVQGVSLDVAPGEIVGVIGPNGAGKTTLFDLLSGFVPLTGGRVPLGGAT